MKKLPVLAAIAAMIVLALSIQGQAPQNQAKGQAKAPVQVKATRVSANFSTLEGQGGTIGVLWGPDGVFMVDTQFANVSEQIAAAIKQITDRPIRYVVNTHLHGDHTGGNENFAKMGATILSRDELRFRMAHPAPAANGKAAAPAVAAALPMLTYSGLTTLRMNGEEIELIPIIRAHTDGDTLIRFVNNDILMTGDFYRAIGYPNIDRTSGGSLNGMLDALAIVIGRAGPNTKIIPGHGPTVNRAAVVAHRDLMLTLRDRMAPLVAQGKTQEEVVAAKLTADLDARVQEPGTTGDRFVGQLYAELKAMQ